MISYVFNFNVNISNEMKCVYYNNIYMYIYHLHLNHLHCLCIRLHSFLLRSTSHALQDTTSP